jgi:hypothetical protein
MCSTEDFFCWQRTEEIGVITMEQPVELGAIPVDLCV